jgi:hypothetical protein
MLRTLLLPILLLTALAGENPSVATGTIGLECMPPIVVVLRLENVPGTQRTVLTYYAMSTPSENKWKPPLHQELDLFAEVYFSSGAKLTPWPIAKVTFDSFGYKDATGSYSLKINDNSVQGRFHVEHQHPPKHHLSVCE